MDPKSADLLNMIRQELAKEFGEHLPAAAPFSRERGGNIQAWLRMRDSSEDPPLAQQLADSLSVVFNYRDYFGPKDEAARDTMKLIAIRLDVAIREWNRDNGHPIDVG